MRFYSSRELAGRLGLPLARWKRWSREFLPPDPLGGLQSGYARQYSLRDAFTVFLGGHLVADLGFAVPDARIVLKQTGTWIRRNLIPAADRLLGLPAGVAAEEDFPRYEIRIVPARDLAGRRIEPLCRIRTVHSHVCLDAAARRYRQEFQDADLAKKAAPDEGGLTIRIVRLSTLCNHLVGRLR